MPDDRLEKARFVRVSKTGDLVFSLGGREMAVSVDDTLERAILEAKQVRSEMRQAPQPHQQSTLPISQIQSLIRAGADPARVAEKYHLSEMLVRRFSMAVETEKQYAIEQFLAVAAPKDSRVRTISELVERTLASAGIGMESVTWKSTRRGLEPWRIVAIFTSAGREIHAEWTWNMHDNSKTARRTESGISHGFQTQADDSRTARRLRTLRAYRARRVCLGGSYAFDSGRTACRNPALCHFHRFHAPSGSIHVHLTGHDPGSWHYGPQSGLFADRRICFAICRRITAIACHGTRAGL